MRIIADENIPFVKEAFSSLGEVCKVSGRSITNALLKDAHILLVRSITNVDAVLLDGTGVRFVGTATVGIDHVDTRYLEQNRIGFASAPGSNADSVAEYVVAALYSLHKKQGLTFTNKKIGVIGIGNIGSRMIRHARTLGMTPLLCDPPLARTTDGQNFVTFEQAVAEADILTFHVPLNVGGPDNTVHLVNETFFSMVKHGAILINTSRGAVVDESSLCNHRHLLGALVMDVWNNEPTIDPAILECTDIATPHIAGYAFDGKVRGTEMIYNAACSFFGAMQKWSPLDSSAEEERTALLTVDKCNPVADAVLQAYPIEEDNRNFRKILAVDKKEHGTFFDLMRKNYRKRREFQHFTIDARSYSPETGTALRSLGFNVTGGTNPS